MSFLPPLVPVERYNAFESKLAASTRWLIRRACDRDIPDMLKEAVVLDEFGRQVLSSAVQTGLTNGSLYGAAAARIFKNGAMVQQCPSMLLTSLAAAGQMVSFRTGEGRERQQIQVTEAHLMSAEPFVQLAHVAMMDALMAVHVRTTITIERAIEAVSRYTSVEPNERPLDSTDALHFWINKICLLVRDDVERSGQRLKGRRKNGEEGGSIPELDDLYEDMCDGCCVAALISFYQPRDLDLAEIVFDEEMSMSACHYNMLLIQRFCDGLPMSPFHFTTEDLLYMHESFQVNVNSFLTDLLDFFEPLAPNSAAEMAAAAVIPSATTPRRFVPIQGIPDLRSANIAARPLHPPKTNRFMDGSVTGPRPARAMSVMSTDSLASGRPSLPLSSRLAQEQQWAATTAFGHVSQQAGDVQPSLSSFAAPAASVVHGTATSPYSRSDSLPAASIRLALEEKRRDHERKKALASTLTEAERAEKGKAAFFALMSKHGKQEESSPAPAATELVDTLTQKVLDLQLQVEQMHQEREGERMARATSQPSIYHDASAPQSARNFSQSGGHAGTLPPGGHYSQPYTGSSTQNEYYFAGGGAGGQYGYDPLQQPYAGGPLRPSLSNGVLNYLPPQGGSMPHNVQYDAYGAPVPTNAQGYYTMGPGGYAHGAQGMQQPTPLHHGMTTSQHGTPTHSAYGNNIMHQSAHASFSLHGHPQSLQQSPMTSATPPRPPSAGPLQQMPPTSGYGMSGIAPPPQYEEALAHTQMMNQGLAQGHPTGSLSAPLGSGDGFRLHAGQSAQSRLDPPLELNRNLTNWGLTYRQGTSGSRPARRTWENETFVKSDRDLVNHPENVPMAEELQAPAPVSSFASRSSRSREETPASVTSTHSGSIHTGGSESEGPPRDPTARAAVAARRSETQENEAPTGPPAGFVIEDDDAAADFEKISEQRRQAKRDALLAKTMKRKEEIGQKVETQEARNAERRAAEMQKQEMAEQRKLEKEIQRQRLLEDYKRKKVEKELGVDSARGSSQPPFARTKSQGLGGDLPSSARSGGLTGRARGQSNVDEARRVPVPSCAEPTLKLYAKASPKSNRALIMNAIQFSVFPGAVSAESRNKVLVELGKSSSKHFLLLFRDHKCQYRGLYEWDQVSDSCSRLHGTGPKLVTEAMMNGMFKYDSGTKTFNNIPTKHLSATIDGLTIKDEFWQKSKIPHSGSSSAAPSHRDN